MIASRLLAGLAFGLFLGPLGAHAQPSPRGAMTEVRGGASRPNLVCNRAEVRDCQADSRLHAQLCEASFDRTMCLDAALRRLQMCWRETGCW